MTNIELKSPLPLLAKSAKKIKPYIGFMMFVLFAAVYGYVLFKINSLANPGPVDESAVLTSVKALPAPRIDNQAAKKLLELKDNSVNVQTLFEDNRTNPFEE